MMKRRRELEASFSDEREKRRVPWLQGPKGKIIYNLKSLCLSGNPRTGRV